MDGFPPRARPHARASRPPEPPVNSPESRPPAGDDAAPGVGHEGGHDRPVAGECPTTVRRFDRPSDPPQDAPVPGTGPRVWEDADAIYAGNPFLDGEAPDATLRDLLGPGTTDEDLAVLL